VASNQLMSYTFIIWLTTKCTSFFIHTQNGYGSIFIHTHNEIHATKYIILPWHECPIRNIQIKKLASIGGCESEHYHHTKTLVDTKKSLLWIHRYICAINNGSGFGKGFLKACMSIPCVVYYYINHLPPHPPLKH